MNGQMSSEEALNGIFGILEVMINQQAEKQQKAEKGETDDKVKNLIQGLIDANNNEATEAVGQQLEKLAKGIQDLSAIDDSALDSVESSVTRLNGILNSMVLDKKSLKEFDNMRKFFEKFSEFTQLNQGLIHELTSFFEGFVDVNQEGVQKGIEVFSSTIKALEIISSLKINKIEKNTKTLVKTLNKFGNDIASAIIVMAHNISRLKDIPDINESIETLNAIFKLLGGNITNNLNKLSTITLSKRKAKKIGKIIGNFIAEIANSLDGKKIDESIEIIFKILDPIIKLGDENSKFSVKNLKKKLNKKLAKAIAGFFITIYEELEKIDQKKLTDTLNGINAFITSLSLNVNPQQFVNKFKPEIAKQIAEFFVTFYEELKKINAKKFKKQTEAISILLKAFAENLINASIALAISNNFLKVKYAENINKFITTLISGELDEKKVKSATKFISEFGNFLAILTGILVILTLLLVFAPIEAVIGGILIMVFSIKMIKSTITKLIEDISDKDVKTSAKVIKALSFVIISISLMIALIAIISSKFGIVSVAAGILVMWLTLKAISSFIEKLSSGEIAKGLEGSMKAIRSISLLLLAITASIAIIAIVTQITSFADIMSGLLVISITLFAMVGIVYLLSKIKKENLEQATSAIWKIGLVLLAVSLIAAFILPKIAENSEEAWSGLAVVGVMIFAMVGIVFLLSKIKNDNLEDATKALMAITTLLLGVSLIALLILPKIADKWKDVAIGALVTIFIILAMVGIVFILSKMDTGDLTQAMISLAAITGVLLAVSLIGLLILPKIGKKWENIAKGALVIMTIILAMVGIVYLLSKIDKDNLMWGIIALAGITLILLVLSFFAVKVFPEVAKHWDDVLIGAGIVLALIGVMTLIVWGLAKIMTGKSGKDLLFGVLALAGIALILAGIAYITKELIIPIGERAMDGLKGAGLIALLIVGMGAIVLAVGKLAENPSIQLYLAIGGVVLAGIGGLLWLLSKMLDPFIDLSIKVYENAKAIALGGLEIAGVLVSVGLLMAGIGALCMNPIVALVLAVGAVVIAGIAGTMLLIKSIINNFIELSKLVKPISDSVIKSTRDKTVAIIEAAKDINSEISGGILGGLGVLFGGGISAIGTLKFIAETTANFKFLRFVAEQMLWINEKITVQDISKFNDVVWRNKEDSLIGGIQNMLDAFNKIDGVFWAMIITKALKPILDTLSYFIDIVMKVATGTYISGYDDNGNPEFEHITAKQFGDAGHEVTLRFQEFLQSLNEGFDGLGFWSTLFMGYMAENLQPVVDLVGKFVDVVMKAATGIYITGYDENGKPEFEHVSAKQFGDAGTQVSLRFAEFLQSLGKGFDSISENAIDTMKDMKKVFNPVMNLVGKFVDVVMKVATGTYVTGYDENGKEMIEHMEASEFGDAAKVVTDSFKTFLYELNNGFKNMSENAIDAMKDMRKVMDPVMKMVSTYVDMVIKVVSGTILTGYDKDKDGNYTVPIYERIDLDEFADAGTKISERFGDFINKLCDSMRSFDDDTEDALEALSENIEPIMESVSKFVDALLKMGAGQYVDRFDPDKDGNYTIPHFAKITNEMMEESAKVIASQFSSFIFQLTFMFKIMEDDVEDALEAIGGTVGPVLEGIGAYVDSVMKLATGTYIDHYEKDDKGKPYPIYEHITKDQFKEAAETVADCFKSFITTIIDKFKDEDFRETAEDAADAIQGSVNPIMSAFKDFADALKPFFGFKQTKKDADGNTQDDLVLLMSPGSSGKSKIEEIAISIANSYTSFIDIIANYLGNENNKKKFEDIKGTADKVNDVISIVKKTVTSLAAINKAFESDNPETDLAAEMSKKAHIFTDLIDIYKNYYSSATLSFYAVKNMANECLEFVKVLSDISTKIRDIIRTVNIENSKEISEKFMDIIIYYAGSIKGIEELLKDVDLTIPVTLTTVLKHISSDYVDISNNVEDSDIQNIQKLCDSIVNVANKFKELNQITTSADILNGVREYTKAIKLLTTGQSENEVTSMIPLLVLYSSHLNRLTIGMMTSTNIIKLFVTDLDKATEALEKLDNQIISKAAEREAALERFASKIDRITESFNKMTKTFEELDGTALVNRFDSLRALLEIAGIDTTQLEEYTNGNLRPERGENGEGGNRTTNNFNGFGTRSGNITVQFANRILDGTYRTT